MDPMPSVGRIVHYVSYGTPGGEFKKEHRAAIITEIDEHDPHRVGLCVLNPSGMFFRSLADGGSSFYEPPKGVIGHHGGSWHWPERTW